MKSNISRPGRFGSFGGAYVPETLMQPILELAEAYESAKVDSKFQQELSVLLRDFVGRATPLYLAERFAKAAGAQNVRIFLKREDLAHTGAHKINNALGQVLLARRMGKTRIVAETGAGQHGVATAAVASRFGMECVVYMGSADMARQGPNVQRMKLLGAKVVPVESGSCTLKDAVSEAMRDWVTHVKGTYYLLGSALGPHPYPTMVRDFQKVIGEEARSQILERTGRLPDELIACVGGGSNALGLFYAFIGDTQVAMTGVEAGGRGPKLGDHAARFGGTADHPMVGGSVGVFQGTETIVLQDEQGQIAQTHSVSAGLDYAAVGPEHAYLASINRAKYACVSDTQALEAFHLLARTEGILPALESSHALSYAFERARSLTAESLTSGSLTSGEKILLVNLSGRGDKDLGLIEKNSFDDIRREQSKNHSK